MEYELLTQIDNTRGKNMKRHGDTKYKYVYIVSYDGVMTYRAEISKFGFYKCFSDVRDAAKAVDREFLKNNKEPVNGTLTKQ